ncbi:ketoacyl-synt-domain-containing protein [Epithele typhae]|uniref:ketoacyl-synt-domain-containing protein n=1 Tax=Epithele typhae TaxID=378194 RepID=UPI002008D5E9|nr:ketoacyl-synt-domain-containing protein [Epithele typhae]KAH9944952.1 ketoacyl-synt-domain-containing protein [Epithele typhae]
MFTALHSRSTPSLHLSQVGVSAQLPSGHTGNVDLNYDSFFDFLLNKREAYEPVHAARFNPKGIKGLAIGQVVADVGAFLKDIDVFDHMEFGVTAKDARLMPLSTRRLIETTFLSLLDSGIDYRGHNVGCYMSGVNADIFAVSGHEDADALGSFAYTPSMIANRVSYHLDLRGPSVPVDTACSSSLYATHLAVQALRCGDCDVAVVGGAQINHKFSDWLSYTQGGILSPDGKCKPFDASANGFGRGEGVVVIVLKPLDAALRDHDHIYASILGTGVNSSGSLAPPSAPVASAQRDAMLRAFVQAGRKPQDCDFVELHATGTAQGDPTEANWVGAEFKRAEELLIGSVKGNIGHLEITAFLASLCKVCGILERRLIPPNVNLAHPNPAIRWTQHRLRVPLEPTDLGCRSPSGRPLIAMTSSGIGGANGHAVIEGPPTSSSRTTFWTEGTEVPVVLMGGGLSPRAASAVCESLVKKAQHPNAQKRELYQIARIFGRRVRSMPWRSFFVADTRSLTMTPTLPDPLLAPKRRPPMVFVFSGQGTQHFDMGRELFATCAPFRDTILELDQTYAAVVGQSLLESTGLFANNSSRKAEDLGEVWPIAITIPALTMLQLALVDALAAVGVTPDIVLGHSAGETPMLAASGASLKTVALELAIARGRAMSVFETPDWSASMAAVNCSAADAATLIDEVKAQPGADPDGVLVVGCYNAPESVTLSGTESLIDAAVALASSRKLFARKLRTRIPVHSPLMDACRAEYERLAADVFTTQGEARVRAPVVTTYSSTTGTPLARQLDDSYYWDNMVQPVRFEQAVSSLLARYRGATFVEIGPHPVLAAYLQVGEGATVTCPMRRARPSKTLPIPLSSSLSPALTSDVLAEVREFTIALGRIATAGHTYVDFDVLYGALCAPLPARVPASSLPAYPFTRRIVPWSSPTAQVQRQQQTRNGPLNYAQLQLNAKTHPDLAEHVIKGAPIMPAAGFVEMALEFGATEVYDVTFHGLLSLAAERPVPIQVALEGTRWTVASAGPVGAGTFPTKYDRLHATGFLSKAPPQDRQYAALDLNALREGMTDVDVDTFYSRLSFFSSYGPLFRRVRRCHFALGSNGAVTALTEIRAKDNNLSNIADYVLHPAILDAAIHVETHPVLTGNFDPNLYHLPSRIHAFRLCSAFFEAELPEIVYSYATYEDWTPDSVTYSFTICNAGGIPLCIMDRLQLARHGFPSDALLKRHEVIYHPIELPSPVDERATDTHIFVFTRSAEMELQPRIAALNPLRALSVAFIARMGIHADAAEGFTRSLRKEFRAWTIRLVVFDPSWAQDRCEATALALTTKAPEEVEFRVDADGTVTVPRVEESAPPTMHSAFDPRAPWTLDGSELVQTFKSQPAGDHVVVKVLGIGTRRGRLWEFVGTVEGRSDSMRVAGIAFGGVSSHVSVHRRAVVELPAAAADAQERPYGYNLLATVVVALAVGPHAFADPDRLRGVHVLLVDDDMDLLVQMEEVCMERGLDVRAASTLDVGVLEACYHRRPTNIIASVEDGSSVATLRGLVAPAGGLLLWDDVQQGVEAIVARAPWDLGDALRQATSRFQRPTVPYLPPLDIGTQTPNGVCRSLGLFDPAKTYLLVGGVGSLGLHIALWMYENGAKSIVLTSRSGEETLERRGDYIAQRILTYLRRCGDVSVTIVAADATDVASMRLAVDGLDRPLGGCVLLAALVRDATFIAHTQESYESVFPSKVQAFSVLEEVLEFEALDFFVSLSSAVGLFGNAGQTNYASANSALTWQTRKYRNAFAMEAPMIVDSSVITVGTETYNRNVRHWTRWGMTARGLCAAIGDGLCILRERPLWQYVPDFDWRGVRDNLGPSPLYDHLVLDNALADIATGAGADGGASLLSIVCAVLELDPEEVDVSVPLTAYGLDSVSAAALSFALRPLLAVSQVQLLVDLSVKDLQSRIEGA